jgi:hypothetical protein
VLATVGFRDFMWRFGYTSRCRPPRSILVWTQSRFQQFPLIFHQSLVSLGLPFSPYDATRGGCYGWKFGNVSLDFWINCSTKSKFKLQKSTTEPMWRNCSELNCSELCCSDVTLWLRVALLKQKRAPRGTTIYGSPRKSC